MVRKMKDSGVEWIGEIPENWKVTTLKRLANIQTGSTPSKDRQALYYSEKGVLWIKPEDLGNDFPISSTKECLTNEGVNNARIMPSNSIYVCCIGSVGKVGYANKKCSCNQQINALSFNDRMNWKYGYYMTISQESEYDLYSNGNVVKIINTTGQSELKCPVPPVDEQEIISLYLDKKCLEIYAAIKKTNESIENYKSLKQSLITRAVTKGVRGKREMKDSGIEWIGEIPVEWNVGKAKYFVNISHGTDPKTEGDIPVYGSGADSFKTCGEYKEGPCVLIGRKGATLHIPHYISTRYWNVDTAFDVKIKNNFNLKFYYYTACCFDYKYYISQTTLPGMTQTNYANMFLPVPSLLEQKEISAYLDEKCSAIDTLIAKKEQLLSELETYKKSLIYEYVTGKREVPV